jgi:Tol biopolymer transport system component
MKKNSFNFSLSLITIGLCFLLVLSLSNTTQAQITQNRFGANRVQYKDFNWRNLSTANFDIYYYDNGTRLANFATRFLETEFDQITKVLGYPPYYKSKIFIYNSISDLQQSNVGIDNDKIVIGGQTDFLKSQIEIPYTGSEEEFKKELRRGVALLLLREMMFGGSLKDMLQSSYLSKFSDWFLLGAAAYVSEGWNEEMDDHMRDIFRKKHTRKPNLLEGEDAVLVGQSIWNFIAEEYGASNISNILNLARIIRNERNSIGSSLGISYNRFLDRWEAYYSGMSEEVRNTLTEREFDFKLRKRNQKNRIFNEFKINPSGSKIAYSEMRGGRYRVIVQNLQTRKRKVIFRDGYRAIGQRFDYNVPLLSWRDNNNLGIMYIRKGENKLLVLNPKKKTSYEREWVFFNHVSGFDFSDDGNFIILSADRKGDLAYKTGQNDLFLFDIENVNLQVITDDWFDDQDPVFLPNSNSAFVFSSNRTDDTLSNTTRTQQGNYDKTLKDYNLFVYDPRETSTRVERLTNSIGRDMKPRFLDPKTLVYLNDESGILQLYKINIDTKIPQQLTQYIQSIRRFEVNPLDNGLAYIMIKKGRSYPYYKRDFDFSQNISGDFKTKRAKILEGRNPQKTIAQNNPSKNKTPEGFESTKVEVEETYSADEVNTDDYVFDADIAQEKRSGLDKAQETMLERVQNTKKNEIKVIGPYEYESRFRTENLLTSFKVDPLRGFGFLAEFTASDLLENHKIRAGAFIAGDLRSSSYYGEYQYLAKRFDFSARFERDFYQFIAQNPLYIQYHALNTFEGTISYAIRNTSRVSITPTYTLLSSVLFIDPVFSPIVFNDRNNYYHYAGLKAEYVYDNTVVNGQNMISGTRLRASYERHFGVATSKNLKDVGVAINNIGFSKISVDIRNYTKIHKDLIFATRIAYGRFGGPAPKSFLLGGMDNWVFNKLDDANGQREARESVAGNIPVIPLLSDNPNVNNPASRDFLAVASNPNGEPVFFGNENVVFNEFVTNLRGFDYNKISGQNVFVANLELRFPIIKYLFGKRVNSNFFKNLQVVGFYDIGSAWTGLSPFNKENSQNTRIIGTDNSPFTARVNDFKNPWLVGYGFGARTIILGYYIKMDVAWAVEDFIVADKPRFYFTFGYDF